ncbi:MAG: hypothetical protein EAZ21_14020 [Betaproteobacteria bacterium]|nr:MAG: hypothetical protein EAZ21_14020 [Betaproteobacteria bacterium]
MTARTNYIFVDHENVSLADTDALNQEHIRLLVFIGANQKRIDIDAVEAIHKLGQRAQYVRVSANGANALDFHIAFYVGRLAQQDERGYFHIISKDKGYDPLIAHLASQEIQAERIDSIALIDFVKATKNEAPQGASKDAQQRTTEKPEEKLRSATGTKVKAALQQARKYFDEYLCAENTSKPSKRSTLKSSIHSFFRKELDTSQVDRIILGLQTKGCLRFEGEKTVWLIAKPDR